MREATTSSVQKVHAPWQRSHSDERVWACLGARACVSLRTTLKSDDALEPGRKREALPAAQWIHTPTRQRYKRGVMAQCTTKHAAQVV